MERQRRQRLTSGVALIGLGLGMWWLQRSGGLGASALFLVLGGAFLAAYLYGRVQGFLVAAGILLGLGTASLLEARVAGWGDPWLLGLGGGFVAIFAVALLYERRASWWPLIPGGILLLLGIPDSERVVGWVLANWPVILIVVGLMILLGSLTGSGGERRAQRSS